MKRNLLLVFATAVLLVACTSEKAETTLTGSFVPANQAPEYLDFLGGEDSTIQVPVTDGRFEIKVPTNKTDISYLFADGQPLQFVADGSTLTFDFVEKTVVSTNKKGLHSRFVEFNKWQDSFMKEYRAKLAGLSEEEQQELADKTVKEFNAHLMEVVKANPDNILGLIGISSMETESTEESLELLEGLADNMKETPNVAGLIELYKTQLSAVEGNPFVDFTIVQDSDFPQLTTVSFSDYVGKDKYVLVSFWASWCEPFREELPFLKEVYNKYKGDNFDMLSVAVGDNPADSQTAAKELGIPWDQIINAQRIPVDLYGIQSLPYYILFGPDGTILKRGIQGEEIGQAVAEALR